MPTIDIIIRDKTASAVNPPCIVCGAVYAAIQEAITNLTNVGE